MKIASIYIFFFSISLTACAGAITQSPDRLWVRHWNSLEYCKDENGKDRNCTYEEAAEEMERGDWIRRSRNVAGMVDRAAETTPVVDPLEREVVYIRIAKLYQDQIEDYHELERRKAELEQSEQTKNTQANLVFVERELSNQSASLLRAKEKAGIYMRKLLELPERNLMSRLMIARIAELLSGEKYPSDLPLEMGARRWTFIFTEQPSVIDDYILHSFIERGKEAASDKRGGKALSYLRAVPLFWGGLRFDDSLVVKEMCGVITLSILDRNGKNPFRHFASIQVKNGATVERYPVLALSKAEVRAKVEERFPHGVTISKIWRESEEVAPAVAEVPEAPAPRHIYSPISPYSVQPRTIRRAPASANQVSESQKREER